MSFLYNITIYPIELALKALFEFLIYVSGNYGFSLIALSFLITIFCIPLRRLAANLHQREKQVHEIMAPQMAQIKANKKGRERQEAINRLYRRYSYHPLLALRSSFGILIQVPFLMAAYYMVRNFAPLAGQSFWVISDLSLPDSLLGPVNFLPILMTAVNLASVCTTPAFTKRDTVQAFFMAGLFLLLLYTSPAALLVYWTFNNFFTLLGNLLNLSKNFQTAKARAKTAILHWLKLANPLNVALAALAAFCLFLYFPVLTYLRNVNEFNFNGPGLLAGLIIPVLATFVAVYLILLLTERRLKKHPVTFFSYSTQATVAHISILALIFAAVIEGAFLSLGLPQLTGTANLFNSKTRLICDSLAWAALIFIPLYFKKFIFNRLSFGMAVIFLTMLIGLGDAYTSRGDKGIVSVETAEVRNKMAFHQDKNVVIIMSDSFPSVTAEEVFKTKPELAAKFEGFTLFHNNLGSSRGVTMYAVPQILRGKTYEEGVFTDFYRAFSTAPGSLVRTAEMRGFNIYMSFPGMPHLNLIRDDSVELSGGFIKFSYDSHQFKQFLFRFMPYMVKKLWSADLSVHAGTVALAADRGTGTVEFLDPKVDNLYKDLVRAASRRSTEPTLHMHHYRGVHPPFTKDRHGDPLGSSEWDSQKGLLEIAEWDLKSLAQYLDFLRSSGLYESSTIIFMGDHGFKEELPFPLFMVKPAGAAGAVTISQAPTSSTYLANLVAVLDDSSENLPKWLKSLPAVRKMGEPPVHYSVVSGIDKDALRFEKKPVIIDRPPTKLVLGQQYAVGSMQLSDLPLAAPSRFENITDLGSTYWFHGTSEGRMSFQSAAKSESVDVVIDFIRNVSNPNREHPPYYALNIWDRTSGNMVTADELPGGISRVILRSVILNENNEVALRLIKSDSKFILELSKIRLEEGGSIPFIAPEVQKSFLAKLDEMQAADKQFSLAVLSASDVFFTGGMYRRYITRQDYLNVPLIHRLTRLLKAPYVLAPISPEEKDADTATGTLSRLISTGKGLGAAYEPVGEPFVLAPTLTVVLYKKTRGFSQAEVETFIGELPAPPEMSVSEMRSLAAD